MSEFGPNGETNQSDPQISDKKFHGGINSHNGLSIRGEATHVRLEVIMQRRLQRSLVYFP